MTQLFTPLAVRSIAWLDRFAELWKKIPFTEISTAFLIDVPLRWLTAIKVGAEDQGVSLKLLEVKSNLLDANAEMLSKGRLSTTGMLGKEYQNLMLYLCAVAAAVLLARYGELLYLRIAIGYKLLKLRYTLAQNRILRKRIAELEVKCHKLLLRERDALVLYRSGCDIADDAFNAVEHTRRLTRSNETEMSGCERERVRLRDKETKS